MALYLLVFSPTGGTKKAAEALLKGFDAPYKTVDCLKQADLSALSFQKDDICVVAAPSFGGRLPQLFAMRLQTLRGNGTRAVPVVVYGNRAYEDTLLELSDLLTDAARLRALPAARGLPPLPNTRFSGSLPPAAPMRTIAPRSCVLGKQSNKNCKVGTQIRWNFRATGLINR